MKTTVPITLFLAACAALGQESTPLPVIQSISTLVTVPVLVRGSSGEIVRNPDINQFQLSDNGTTQKFSIEDTANEPIGLAVLIQTGGTGASEFQNYRNLPNLLKSIVGSSAHEIMLMTFDSHLEEVWHFPPRSDGLLHSLELPRSGDTGVALMDTVNYAVNLFQQEPGNFRRIVLLISQARDGGSNISAEEIIHNLGKGSTAVYSLTFSPRKKNRPTFRSKSKKPKPNETPSSEARPHPASAPPIDTSTPLGSALKSMQENTAAELAILSGGEHLRFRNAQEFEQEMSAIAEDIHNRSVLTFHPSSREPGFHQLQLQEVGRSHHLNISARTSYWFDTSENR